MIPAWVGVASVAALVVVLASFYVSWRAGRLDRLHTRVETARAALDAALARRHTVVVEFAAAPWLDPASSLLLAEAAGRARQASEGADRESRELAESALSRTLRTVAEESGAEGDGTDTGLWEEIATETRRTHIARRFYNDAVAATRHARASRLVRVLRLAGSAPMPEFFEMDDEPPRTYPI